MNLFEQAREQLMAGIKVYVDRAIREANCDRTYTGFIIEREKDDTGAYTGLYSVMVSSNKYTKVPAINSANILVKGAPVRVLAPMNNFSNIVILN